MSKYLPPTPVICLLAGLGLLLNYTVYRHSVGLSAAPESILEQPSCLPQGAETPHPDCGNVGIGRFTSFDATPLFESLLPAEVRGACIFNPAILHYSGDLYLWFAWAYHSPGLDRCRGPTSPNGSWAQGWDEGQFVWFQTAALVQHDLETGRPLRVVYSKHFGVGDPDHLWEYMKLDARLFRDQFGKIMLAHGSLWTEGRGSTPILMSVSELLIEESSHGGLSIHLGRTTNLPYLNISSAEKNWVPWNGTSLMSYPHYRDFQPHSVFDWKSYSNPLSHSVFHSQTPIPFVAAFNKLFGGSFHLSGGTPAIMDEGSWLAAGHMIGPAIECHRTVPVLNGTETKVPGISASGLMGESFVGQSGYGHHMKEYFTFFYRFAAEPPYRFTFVSDAFKLPKAPPQLGPHLGVVYPMGLELMGADKFLLSYGEDDWRVKVLVLERHQLRSLLKPILSQTDTDEALRSYKFCTLPGDTLLATA